MELFFISDNTTISNTVDWITRISLKGTAHPDCIEIAKKCAASKDPLKTLFDTAYERIVYVPDEPATQTLRSMNNIITTGKGNCVHYTTLISSVCMLLGKPHYRKVVSYDKPDVFEHIYVECEDKILDPVLNQRQDGTDEYYRPDCGEYNKEKSYKYKLLYYMPKLQILNGTKSDIKNNVPDNFGSRSRYIRQLRAYGSIGCTKSPLGCGLGCSCMAIKNTK